MYVRRSVIRKDKVPLLLFIEISTTSLILVLVDVVIIIEREKL